MQPGPFFTSISIWERKRNKVDDKYVILSSVVLQPILIIVCFYDGETISVWNSV